MLPKMMKKFGQSLDHHSASPDRLEKCKSCFKLRTFSDPPPFSTLWAGKGFNEWLCSLLQPLPLRFMKHHNFSKRSSSVIFGPTEDPKKRKMIRI